MTKREPQTGINQWAKYAERFVTSAIDAEIAATGSPVRSFLAEKGDVLIWHGRLIHRGSKGQKGVLRKSLITHYSGINHRLDMLIRAEDPNGQHYAVFDEPPNL